MATKTSIRSGAGYFLYHSIGMFPEKERVISEALADFSSIWGCPNDEQWPQVLNLRSRFIQHWAEIIAADPACVTTAENVTSGLYSIIGSLEKEAIKGKRVLIAADCFPSLHFLLQALQERFGFQLDTVPLRAGESWVRDEDFIARWQDDVGVALITFVTSIASHRPQLDLLFEHGRKQGSIIGVDITQGVGIVPFDVNQPKADFVVSTTLKWLGGAPGAGIIYVRDGLMQKCTPEFRGWFSQENFMSWDLDAFEFARDARRFDHGTPSSVAAVASVPALQWHLEQDPNLMLAHNRKLVDILMNELPPMGLDCASPEAAERRGSVMFRLPQNIVASEVVDGLRDGGVYIDARGQILRLSPGNVTTEEGVEKALSLLQGLIKI
jgi:kynureninase